MIITGSIKIFDIVYIMTEGGPNGMTQVPAVMMYNEAFKYNHYGLGSAIGGMADSYWSKNKGRSMEGTLVKVTRVVAVLFIVLAVVLNLKIFN